MDDGINVKVSNGSGLVNIGNSCFFNSILQALFHLPSLNHCFRKSKIACDFTVVDECIVCAVQKLYEATKCSKLPCNPENVYEMLQKSPRLATVLNGEQQDAHEFFKLFINEITFYQHPESELARYFTADICTEITCQTCRTTFKKTSSVADFIVNIQRKRTVAEAFHSFFELETINTYDCIVCMKSVLATKRCVLASAPECLCIILNRISERQTKINKNIEISHQLYVKWVSENIVRTRKYGLVSVSSHIGGSYNRGHYTTSVQTNNNIYKFDDSRVRKQRSISGLHAYILFYEPIEVMKYASASVLCLFTAENAFESKQNKESAYESKDVLVNEFTENENKWRFVENEDQCMRNVIKDGCLDKSLDCQYIENEVLLEHNYCLHPLQDSEILSPVEIVDEILSDGLNSLNEDQTSRYMENEVMNNDTKENINLTDSHSGHSQTQDSSRRIMDAEYVFSQMQKFFTVLCRKCDGDISFTNEAKRGLNSKFQFTCSSCSRTTKIDSCPKDKSQANNNEAAVTGIISVGLGYSHLQEFLAHLNIPCMSYQTFYNTEKILQEDWWALAKDLESKALVNEIQFAKEANETDSAGNALIAVKVDGSWQKRSYYGNFSSLAGCAAIVGIKTNKILYSGVKNKYCHTCKIAAANNLTPKTHDCNANYSGAPSGMEKDIILEGFKFCAEKGARFHKFIGDGDSSTYKTLRDQRLYQNPTVYIDKYDCIGHLHKNFLKKGITIVKKSKTEGRKLISAKIVEDISIGVRMAAKHWNECDISLGEKCRNLEKDCMNAFLHCLDVHDDCSEYFCSKITSPGARDRLALLKSDGRYYKILSLCQYYFANKAKSLLAGYDNNVVEGFNSIIAKYLGGKRVFNAQARSYKSRTAMAGVHLNSGYRGGSTFQRFKYGKALPEMVKMENQRKRKVEITTIRKQKNPKKRRVEDDEGGKKKKRAYGEGHEEVDITPAQYETAKKIFLDRINEDQVNRHRIELQTQDKRYSDKYCQIMQDLLTSTYFSRVLHARNRKSYKKIVEDILYHNVLYSNAADLVHQRLYEKEALDLFSSLYKSESIDVCGVFIDTEFSFLAASPLRLFGRDGIVVVKCPLNVFKKSINDAIQRKMIPFWSKSKESDESVVNINSHWYAEIQGELHVCRKKYAYLMVYLGTTEFKIEKIERDDEYWKTKMESKLVYFFNEAMLKELVDSRDGRDMELRDYDEKTESFI